MAGKIKIKKSTHKGTYSNDTVVSIPKGGIRL